MFFVGALGQSLLDTELVKDDPHVVPDPRGLLLASKLKDATLGPFHGPPSFFKQLPSLNLIIFIECPRINPGAFASRAPCHFGLLPLAGDTHAWRRRCSHKPRCKSIWRLVLGRYLCHEWIASTCQYPIGCSIGFKHSGSFAFYGAQKATPPALATSTVVRVAASIAYETDGRSIGPVVARFPTQSKRVFGCLRSGCGGRKCGVRESVCPCPKASCASSTFEPISTASSAHDSLWPHLGPSGALGGLHVIMHSFRCFNCLERSSAMWADGASWCRKVQPFAVSATQGASRIKRQN